MKRLIVTLGIIFLVFMMVESKEVFGQQRPEGLKSEVRKEPEKPTKPEELPERTVKPQILEQAPKGLPERTVKPPETKGAEEENKQAPSGYIRRVEIAQAPLSEKQSPSTQVVTATREWTTIEIFLSAAILLFALAIFVLQSILMFRLKIEWTPQSILRFNGITLIVSGALLLVVAGYSNQQVAPVMGLLGTIAGYLLGSKEKTEK